MPQAIPVELKEKVKMVAMQVGVREAARQFEISEDTVMAWSRREGWLTQKADAQSVKGEIIESRGLHALARKTPSDVLKSFGERSKLRAARVGDRTLAAIAKKKDDNLVKASGSYLNTVNALAKVHGWGSESDGTSPLVSVNILSANVPDVTHVADA